MSAIVSAAEARRSRVRLSHRDDAVSGHDRQLRRPRHAFDRRPRAVQRASSRSRRHGLRLFGLRLVLCDRAGAGRMAARPLRLEVGSIRSASSSGRCSRCCRAGSASSAAAAAIVVLFALRFLVGLAEAPSFPANARIVAAWFPGNERGTASAFFNSGAVFRDRDLRAADGLDRARLRLAQRLLRDGRARHPDGRSSGSRPIYGPKDHPGINEAEFDYIKDGGALVDMDAKDAEVAPSSGPEVGPHPASCSATA